MTTPKKTIPKTLHQRRLSPVKSFRLRTDVPAPDPNPSAPNLPFRGDPVSEANKERGHLKQGREVSKATGGPRTPEGKAISARNSTTHGLFARQTVLPHLGEDPEGYRILLKTLVDQIKPRNLIEEQYLELWAEASWKLRRLSRLEADLWEQKERTPAERLSDLDKLGRLHARLCRQMDKAVRMLGTDVPDLLRRRAREETLHKNNATEAQCARDSHLAELVERVTRSESRQTALPTLDPDTLDYVAAGKPAQDPVELTASPEYDDALKCENEPEPDSAPFPASGSAYALYYRWEQERAKRENLDAKSAAHASAPTEKQEAYA